VLDALATSRDLVLVFDRQGRTTYRNEAARVRAPESVTATEQFPPDYRGVFEAAARIAATGTSVTFEWGETTPAGIRCWFSSELTPHADGTICISRDVTELKRSEQRLRRSEQLLVDTHGVAHLGTWEWDITEPTATWSAELYRIYGVTPETYTPSYESYLKKVHDDDRQRVIDATNRVFHEHVPYSHDERIHWPDGSIRFLHTWAYPVLDDTGKLTRLVGVCQDITDRALAEEAVRELNSALEHRVLERTQQLENALRDLEAFNTMVTHDLRGPLLAIQMTADIIARDAGASSPRTLAHVEQIRLAIRNMSTLMNDLLAFARVGQGAIKATDVDISALADEVVREIRATAPDRQGEIVIAPKLRCRVDASLFRIVLTNLISNAWKYTSRQASPRIELGSVERADGRCLFIRDNGVGFDMEEKARLFAPFERLTTAAEFGGTGIGLAIVQRIVERHGGRVDAESVPDKGATFFVVLPPAAWI
jgi:PAS domain S-box-containing protein